MSLYKLIIISLFMTVQAFSTLSFSHHDWEVTCDNTNTCRIVGYSPKDAKLPLSVIVVSKAGDAELPKAKVQLGLFGGEEEKIFATFPLNFNLEMKVNNKSLGLVAMNKHDLIASLSKKQTSALLASFKHTSNIVWKTGEYTWELSDKGSSAVLLKVDEFQKRLGTTSALLKKGNKHNQNLLRPKAMPIIEVPALNASKELSIDTLDIQKSEMQKLEKALKRNQKWCFEERLYDKKVRLYPLNEQKLLASKLCWTAAYNMGTAYWVINKQAPYTPQLITTDASDYYVDDNHVATIHTAQKGRGIGDCWSVESHVWNGKTFVPNYKAHTGACRAIAAGGAWKLPSFVSKVVVK